MSGRLKTDLGLDAPDDVYQALVELHRGLDDAQARLVDAKLILLLANHVGDRQVLEEAIAKAREQLAAPTPPNRG